jgi:hypothetical protein
VKARFRTPLILLPTAVRMVGGGAPVQALPSRQDVGVPPHAVQGQRQRAGTSPNLIRSIRILSCRLHRLLPPQWCLGSLCPVFPLPVQYQVDSETGEHVVVGAGVRLLVVHLLCVFPPIVRGFLPLCAFLMLESPPPLLPAHSLDPLPASLRRASAGSCAEGAHPGVRHRDCCIPARGVPP